MFVWECIKSEGTHVGVCVDTFMFGSCCVHNATSNSISSHKPPTSSNTLRPTLAEALSSESTRLTLTSLSSLVYSSTSTTRPSSQPPVSQKEDVNSTSQLSGSENHGGSSMKPLKPLSGSQSRPLQKRPHAKPSSDQEDRLQTSMVPGQASEFWEKNSQDSRRPEGGHQEAHDYQQIMKTQPESSEQQLNNDQVDDVGKGDHQGFEDKIDNKHSTLLIRLPNKNQGSIKGQELRPFRPDYSQRPSESRPDDSKTQESDLAVQETSYRPNVNSVDDKVRVFLFT